MGPQLVGEAGSEVIDEQHYARLTQLKQVYICTHLLIIPVHVRTLYYILVTFYMYNVHNVQHIRAERNLIETPYYSPWFSARN